MYIYIYQYAMYTIHRNDLHIQFRMLFECLKTTEYQCSLCMYQRCTI